MRSAGFQPAAPPPSRRHGRGPAFTRALLSPCNNKNVKPAVYVENSVVSYLTARRTRGSLRVAAHQDLTREWWDTRRQAFELFGSAVVVEEAQDGDPDAAAARLEVVRQLTMLEVTQEARDLAATLLRETRLPAKANADALHIATAAVHGMDYLITWNCKHIANAVILRSVEAVCRANGYEPPVICTPEELMEG